MCASASMHRAGGANTHAHAHAGGVLGDKKGAKRPRDLGIQDSMSLGAAKKASKGLGLGQRGRGPDTAELGSLPPPPPPVSLVSSPGGRMGKVAVDETDSANDCKAVAEDVAVDIGVGDELAIHPQDPVGEASPPPATPPRRPQALQAAVLGGGNKERMGQPLNMVRGPQK